MAPWVAERMTPHPLATYDECLPLDTPESTALPHLFDPVEALVREWRWPVQHLDTGHDAMIAPPHELTGTLLTYAESFVSD